MRNQFLLLTRKRLFNPAKRRSILISEKIIETIITLLFTINIWLLNTVAKLGLAITSEKTTKKQLHKSKERMRETFSSKKHLKKNLFFFVLFFKFLYFSNRRIFVVVTGSRNFEVFTLLRAVFIFLRSLSVYRISYPYLFFLIQNCA